MRKKQTAATAAAEGRAASADSSDLDPDLDTCPAPEPAPFRTVIGGHQEGQQPYLWGNDVKEPGAVVIIDLDAWKAALEDRKEVYSQMYYQIMVRIRTSLMTAGNQGRNMCIYLTTEDSVITRGPGVGHITYIVDYLHDPGYLRDFAESRMECVKPIVFVYITDVFDDTHRRTWDYLSNLDYVVAAHLHVYDQPKIRDSRTNSYELRAIYNRVPAQYSYKYREAPKPEPMEKEEESDEVNEEVKPEEVEAIVPNDHPAHRGGDFTRFLEKAADVYGRVA